MSKILINQSGSDVVMNDVGVTIAGSSSYTIPPQDYPAFAASSDVIKFLSDPSILILNDGGNDITNLSKAIDIIKGWPVQSSITDDDNETPFFFDYDDIPAGVGPISLLSFAIAAGQELALKRVSFSCRIESQLRILKNGITIGQLLNGAAQPSSNFDWRPDYILVENDILEIVLTKRNGAPDTDVGVHVMGVLTTL